MRPMWPSGSSRPQPIARPAGVLGQRMRHVGVDAVPFEALGHLLLDDEHLVPERAQRRLVRRPVGEAHGKAAAGGRRTTDGQRDVAGAGADRQRAAAADRQRQLVGTMAERQAR